MCMEFKIVSTHKRQNVVLKKIDCNNCNHVSLKKLSSIHLSTNNMKISIEGNIASGKSTLVSRLQQTTRIPVFLEPVNNWTLLDKFYEDQTRWGFTFNTEVLLSMHKWKTNNYNSIYERSPNSCRFVFAQLMFDDGILTKEELVLFDKLFEGYGWDQDAIIYVRTPPEICYQRMHQRGRECESNVSLEYLQKLDKAHDFMLDLLQKQKPEIKIIEIDGIACADDVYKNVLTILGTEMCVI